MELRVNRHPFINNETRPDKAPKSSRKKPRGKGHHDELLDEVRMMDNKMRALMDSLEEDANYERSRGFEPLSSSGASDICTVARNYATTLEKFLSKHKRSDSDGLEDQINFHLVKIRHQIRLVEKYNR